MKSIKITNLDDDVTREDLIRLFGRFGAMQDLQIYAERIFNRFAVVVYYENTSAEQAKSLDGMKLAGRYITVS